MAPQRDPQISPNRQTSEKQVGLGRPLQKYIKKVSQTNWLLEGFEVILEQILESLSCHAEYVKIELPLKREPHFAGWEGVLIGTFFLLLLMLFLKPLFFTNTPPHKPPFWEPFGPQHRKKYVQKGLKK